MLCRSLRAAREGEMILSVNGSPLGEFSTVVKMPKENNSIIPLTPGKDMIISNASPLNSFSHAQNF